MGQGASASRAVPVLLIRFDLDGVPDTDPLGGGTSGLDPSRSVDDLEKLTAFVDVPVVARARFEAYDHRRRRKRRLTRRQQLPSARRPREMG